MLVVVEAAGAKVISGMDWASVFCLVRCEVDGFRGEWTNLPVG